MNASPSRLVAPLLALLAGCAVGPDFDEAELERAFRHFAGRQRRYGLIDGQVAGG